MIPLRVEMSFPIMVLSWQRLRLPGSFWILWGDGGHHTWGAARKAISGVFPWIPHEVHLVAVAKLHSSEHRLVHVDVLSSVGTRGRVLSRGVLWHG